MSLEASNTAGKTTTARRELLGWTGAMTYMFLMMWGHQMFIVGSMGFHHGSWVDSVAMLTFALSIAVLSFSLGRDPNKLARIATYATPAAIVITLAVGFLSEPFASVLYVLACALMAPAIARSVYGVIRTAPAQSRFTRYMVGWTIALTVFALWVIASLPKEVTFLVPAAFAVLAWFGMRREVSISDGQKQEHRQGQRQGQGQLAPRKLTYSKSSLFLFGLTLLVMVWFNFMADMLLNNLFAGGDLNSQVAVIVGTLATWIPLGLGLLIFGIVSDKGHEQGGFMVTMGLFLVSIMCLILLNTTKSAFYLPLAIANVIGAMYVVFFACTFSIYFLLAGAKRPVFIASVGCIFFTAFQAVCWQKAVFLPESLITLGIPLFVSAAITAVLFAGLVYYLYTHFQERTLAATLYDLLHDSLKEEAAIGELSEPQDPPAMIAAGLTAEELDVALLLIDGGTRRDISHKLHLSAAEVAQRTNSIRSKVIGASDPDPVVAAAVVEYKLTRRETDMLRCLRRGMPNNEIAAELFLSEETVKSHVRRLMKKLPVESRQDIATWTGASSE